VEERRERATEVLAAFPPPEVTIDSERDLVLGVGYVWSVAIVSSAAVPIIRILLVVVGMVVGMVVMVVLAWWWWWWWVEEDDMLCGD